MTERTFHGPRDYLDLARSAEATADELRLLASSPYAFVVEAVARHPGTPPDVLSQLVPSSVASLSEQSLMLALARNPETPESALRQLARLVGPSLHIRDAPQGFKAGIALFERPDTPDDLLLDLLADAEVTTQFRKVAARETTHGDILRTLMSDRSESVRRAAQARGAGSS